MISDKYSVNPNLISLLLFVVSGYFSGLAFTAPDYYLFAWLGMLVLPYAFYLTKNTYVKILGFSLYVLVFQYSGHNWYMLSVYLAGRGAIPTLKLIILWLLFMVTVMVIPQSTPFIIGLILNKKKSVPFFIWFPFAYISGEYLIFNFSGLSMGNWLYSQYTFTPVLKSLGYLGWNVSLILCLSIPLSLSEGVILKKFKYLYVSFTGILILIFLPPLNNNIPEILKDVGVIYTDSEVFRPHNINNKIKLLIWPETARSGRPRLKEGLEQHLRIRPPLLSNDIFHVIGLETRIPEGLQNSVLALSPKGDVLSVRAKKELFPSLETKFYGFIFPGRAPYIPGVNPAYIKIKDKKIITLLCFEQMDRKLIKEALSDGKAELIAVMARDTVLGGSDEIYNQFAAMSVLIAVENGIPVVRSSVSGPAVIVAPNGQILARSEINKEGILSLNQKTN